MINKPVKNVDGKIVGFINNNQMLCKKVVKSKHFMRVLNGWGLDKAIIDAGGFDEVRILDTENNVCYSSKREDWIMHGIKKDFGHGEQLILPVKWHKLTYRN